ncbi:Hypothetical protein NTJ_10528 [Nesidiocoris tenuis]|uniref:Uncharacterized protein n=1 Tax=Nesidiocoris tenuis TaxID=355587 RepID=A0ABN7B1N2_9HEMI|nr:Hypothetical protein NTJ_10528 [Nesidiocoris tenuis]
MIISEKRCLCVKPSLSSRRLQYFFSIAAREVFDSNELLEGWKRKGPDSQDALEWPRHKWREFEMSWSFDRTGTNCVNSGASLSTEFPAPG